MASQPPLPEFTAPSGKGDRSVVQVVDEPRPAVASLTPLVLTGEPATDKGFITEKGERIRARLVPKTVEEGEEEARGTTVLELSLALLDETNSVQTDTEGEFKISPKHEIYLVPGLMVEGVDIAAFIETEIRKAAYHFRVMEDQKVEITNLLANWGAPV